MFLINYKHFVIKRQSLFSGKSIRGLSMLNIQSLDYGSYFPCTKEGLSVHCLCIVCALAVHLLCYYCTINAQ